MLTDINPKLPMRDKAATQDYYVNKLGFQVYGSADHEGYLMVQKDTIQIHFFERFYIFTYITLKVFFV